ncbi:MAG: glycosyltransferase family 39 protein [Alphaproteobacteria bacterium]
MSASAGAASGSRGPSTLSIMLAVILGLTAIRLVVLFNTFLNLGGDEAQYWAWSRTLDFGYFSKPPLIAWIIAGTTAICGNGEACVRVSSPLLHGATAIAIFFAARRLYDERIGLWSAITYATLPIVFFSSALITTDVPCIFCWACALLGVDAMNKAHSAGHAREALQAGALTGLAVGVGLLAKYAMFYFPLCMIVHAVVSRDARRAMLSLAGATLAIVALIVLSPNLIWNVQQGFATVKHTAADANWGGQLFNVSALGAFISSQVGVFGPVLFVTFLFGLVNLERRATGPYKNSDIMLVCYSVPILAIVIVQSFISRANANWAAPAYIAATILTVAWLLRPASTPKPKRWYSVTGRGLLNASLAIHLVAGITLYSLGTVPGAIELFAVGNSFKRVRGWEGFRTKYLEVVQKGHYRAVVTDDRMIMAEVIYYGRDSHVPVVIFDINGVPANEFELKAPYTPALGDPVLLVTPRDVSPVVDNFSVAEPVEVYRMHRGGRYYTDFHFIRLADFKGSRAG